MKEVICVNLLPPSSYAGGVGEDAGYDVVVFEGGEEDVDEGGHVLCDEGLEAEGIWSGHCIRREYEF